MFEFIFGSGFGVRRSVRLKVDTTDAAFPRSCVVSGFSRTGRTLRREKIEA